MECITQEQDYLAEDKFVCSHHSEDGLDKHEITRGIAWDTASIGEKRTTQRRRAKTTADVSSAIQMLEKLVRKLQRLYDILPKPIEQQLVLEDGDGSAKYESVKRRANNDGLNGPSGHGLGGVGKRR